MKFTILVAACLFQQKVNLELTFPAFPSLSELSRHIESTFSVEATALRPPGRAFEPFRVARLQIFDDRLGQWVDLLTSNQLVEFAQVYAFARDSSGETQSAIPPARAPIASAGGVSPANVSPPRRDSSPVRNSYGGASSSSRLGALGSTPSNPIPQSPYTGFSSPATAGTPGMRVPPSTPVPSYGINPHVSPVSTARRAHSPTRDVTGGGVFQLHTSGAATPAARFDASSAASFEGKARAIFDEADTARNRALSMEDFRRLLAICHVDFTATVTADLYARADRDHDGVISSAEWSQFAANYPTLVDALYFRSKEKYEELRRRQAGEAQKAVTEEARRREARSRGQHEAVRRDVETQERNLQLLETELGSRLNKEQDVRNQLADAHREVERCNRERTERERDVVSGKERERQRQGTVLETQRNLDQAERTVKGQEAEVQRAQEKERQLEALLAEARRDTERQVGSLQSQVQELKKWREREQQVQVAHNESQSDVARLNDSLSQAEMQLARCIEAEREREVMVGEAQREAARAAARRDEEERELQLQREREIHHARLVDEAGRAISEAEARMRHIEQELAEYLQRRQAIEAQELPLIEQEVRLREQRFSLEEREIKLRTEAGTFAATTGRR